MFEGFIGQQDQESIDELFWQLNGFIGRQSKTLMLNFSFIDWFNILVWLYEFLIEWLFDWATDFMTAWLYDRINLWLYE